MTLRVDVLGALRVEVRGAPVEISSPRLRALLVALALTPGQSVPAEELAQLMWGTDAPRSRARVHTVVARLRKLLGDAVRTTSDGYELVAGTDAVDVSRFTRLLDGAEQAGDPDRERAMLRDALAVWRGEPICLERSPGLVERYLGALQRRADLGLAANDLDGLVTELTDGVAAYPLHEPLWERFIRVLSATGRTAEALAVYADCRTVLRTELGVEPNAALQRLYLELLDDGEQPNGTTTGGKEPAAEGWTARMRPRQLPAAVSGFVGRTEELRFLHDAWREHAESASASQSVPTFVVHGVGGVGKTALAVRWAHQIAHRYPDGQLYFDLRGYGPGKPVEVGAALSTFLHALGVPERAVPAEFAERAALLRTVLAGQRVLIVLDNARDSEQVRPLLPGSGCLVVVTSRGMLRSLCVRDGARSLHLRQMSRSEAAELLASTAGDARIAAEAAAASDLATLCGHLPLALRITADLASRPPDTPLAELVDELRAQRLETLADQVDDATDPRAVFSWSYRELRPADAQLFRLLSLSPGNHFGAAAAAALAGRPVVETRRALDRLVAVHLLEQRNPSRYQFHDLLREYAAELTAAADPPATREAVVRRVLGWFTRTAMSASRVFAPGRQLWSETSIPEPSPFPDQLHALDWFESERESLGVAVRLAELAGADDLAWLLAAALSAYFVVHPDGDEWEATYQAALDSADRLGDRTARAAILTGIGTIRVYLGRDDEALRFYCQALEMFELERARAQQATVLVLMGNALEYLGRHTEAQDRHRASLAISQEIGDEAREAHALSNLAITAMSLGQYDEAVAHSQRSLRLRRTTGDERGRAHTLDNLGDACVELGEFQRAIACYQEAVTLARTFRDRRNEGIHLGNLARAELRAGQDDQARRTAAKAWAALAGIPDADAGKIRERLRAAFPDVGAGELG